jgi:predicted dehydrogenase
MIGVAIIGAGYWGPNLIRNFSNCESTRVLAVCDRDHRRLTRVAASCPQAQLTQNVEDILKNPEIAAVAIATPVSTHAPLSLAAMEAGKDVLVEKPLADNVRDAERLVSRARELGRTLMVDHTYIYSPAIRKIKELVDAGELGEIYYIDSVRINLGQFQSDINVLWDLAPHDLAIIDHLLGRLPRSLAAMGVSHTSSDLEDVAYLNLDFGRSLMATFHVNWLSPVKLRHTIIGGSKRSLVFNDLDPVEPIKIYDCGIQLDQTPKPGTVFSSATGRVTFGRRTWRAMNRCKMWFETSPIASGAERRPSRTGRRACGLCESSKQHSAASRPKADASPYNALTSSHCAAESGGETR